MQQTFEATIDILFNPIQATILSQEIPKVFLPASTVLKTILHIQKSAYTFIVLSLTSTPVLFGILTCSSVK